MQPWMQTAHKLEERFGIPQGLLVALVRQESGGRMVTSPAGAIGPAQLMPGTAQSLGVNPRDFNDNLRGGAMYLSQQLKAFKGDINRALAAYNAGPGAVSKYGGIPPYAETQNYVKRVNSLWNSARGDRPRTPARRPGAAPAPLLRTPQAPLAPVELNPRERARLDAMKLASRKFDPVDVDENQIRRLALAGDPSTVIRGVNSSRQQQTEQYNQGAQQFNQQLESKMLADKQQTIQRQAQLDWMKRQAGAFSQAQQRAGASYAPVTAPGAKGYFRTPEGLIQNRREGEAAWQFLQRLGGKGFGLQNDPGNSQTTGGRHSAGSLHYDGRAIDFGDGRNSRDQLQKFYDWLKPRRETLGIEELIWQQPDHYDHIHVGLRE